jgi:hypothetical protein
MNVLIKGWLNETAFFPLSSKHLDTRYRITAEYFFLIPEAKKYPEINVPKHNAGNIRACRKGWDSFSAAVLWVQDNWSC